MTYTEIRNQINKEWPTTKKLKYFLYADPFLLYKIPYDIETFFSDNPFMQTGYPIENKRLSLLYNPHPGKSGIVYNPNKTTIEDIKRDLLHIYREQDPIYKDLLTRFEDYAANNDWVQGDKDRGIKLFLKSVPKEYKPTKSDYKHAFENAVDGTLRGLLSSPNNRNSYWPAYKDKDVFNSGYTEEDKIGMETTFKELKNYLEGKPYAYYEGYLPELVVTQKINKK